MVITKFRMHLNFSEAYVVIRGELDKRDLGNRDREEKYRLICVATFTAVPRVACLKLRQYSQEIKSKSLQTIECIV